MSATDSSHLSVKVQAHAGELGSLPDIDPSRLIVTRSTNLKAVPDPDTLKFGETMTDHMLMMDFAPERGWSPPEIKPYGPLQLDPSCSVFHYTPALFEGMKAYVGPDGQPRLFRPQMNMQRMIRSADRVALPTFDSDALLNLIKQLIVIDQRWIPRKEGYSLYIRPTLIGTRAALGVAASTHAMLYVLLSPSGPMFSDGLSPIRLFAETDHVRAWPGGTGQYKLGINYTPTFRPQREAAKKGYNQVLWILKDSDGNLNCTEAGQMNFFAVFKRPDGDFDVCTPPLDGTILPGVTRDSVLKLCAKFGTDPGLKKLLEASSSSLPKLHAQEKKISLADLQVHERKGTLVEIFGAGTAAVIASIGTIGMRDPASTDPDSLMELSIHGGVGEVTRSMYTAIIAIQEGRVAVDDWSVTCE